MGKVKEWAMEMEEIKLSQLAKALDITEEEASLLGYDVWANNSKNGALCSYKLEFYNNNPTVILDKINRLDENLCVILEPEELDPEAFEYGLIYNSIIDNVNYYSNYKDAISDLKTLFKLEPLVDDKLMLTLYRQIFIGVISVMETYLSDAFIINTLENELFYRNFISTHPEFAKRKFELRNIFEMNEQIKSIAKKIMLDVIFHKLPTVKRMYESTFDFKFPNITKAFEFVIIRHDLVHRNGKTKEGKTIVVDKLFLKELFSTISLLIEELDQNLNKELDKFLPF